MAAQKRKSVEVDEIAAAPTRCANGCGFFGNPATGGLCSKCHREHAAVATTELCGATAATDEEKMMHAVFDTSVVFAPPEKKARTTMACAAVLPPSPDADASAAAPAPSTAEQQAAETKPAVANRCTACRKKVGLLGFRCCCGDTFCGAHRYAEKHACSFDYRTAARERIANNNPVVVADKIAKI